VHVATMKSKVNRTASADTTITSYPGTHKIQGPEYEKDGGLRRPFQVKQGG
jgi:hypothetical protein